MNKYVGAWLLLAAEAAFFVLFRGDYGRRFVEFLPIIVIAELYYVQEFATAFRSIRKFCPGRIAAARVRYIPTAVGLLGFAAIGIGIIRADYILPVAIVAVVMTAWGKVLVYRYVERTGVLT